ncbi:hypothetical protein [Longibacter sp.]|uniref:hypothetical protein n=1 Tax=Longibacter sp. TaxID=2045415 RepID=UPI003EC1107A
MVPSPSGWVPADPGRNRLRRSAGGTEPTIFAFGTKGIARPTGGAAHRLSFVPPALRGATGACSLIR